MRQIDHMTVDDWNILFLHLSAFLIRNQHQGPIAPCVASSDNDISDSDTRLKEEEVVIAPECEMTFGVAVEP